MNRLRIALLALLVSCFAAPVVAQSGAGMKRITVASAVRVRSGPSTTANVLETLSVGVLLDELGRSERPDKVGEQQDYWYHVKLATGKDGWVFGGLTQAVDPSAVDEAYQRIATERLSRSDLGFADLLDAVMFLSRASGSAKSRDAKGRLELAHLQMVEKAAAAIPFDQREKAPYKAWITSQERSNMRLDEVQGAYLVNDALFWKIADTYADTKAGDDLAWAAAEANLGGECEGDVSCNLVAFNRMHGRYLSSYPAGAHAAKAVQDFVNYLQESVENVKREPGIFTGLPGDEAGYMTEYRNAIAEAKATVKKTSAPGRDRAIALLDELDGLTRK